jgi:hypothetical protein
MLLSRHPIAPPPERGSRVLRCVALASNAANHGHARGRSRRLAHSLTAMRSIALPPGNAMARDGRAGRDGSDGSAMCMV